MAEAIIQGLVSQKVLPESAVYVCDRNQHKRDRYKSTGVQVVESVNQLTSCDVIVLAVKPYAAAEALAGLGTDCSSLLVSVCAGVKIEALSAMLVSKSMRVVRVMPNTPCLVGSGASGYSLGPATSAEDDKLVRMLFESISLMVPVDESKLDAITGLSGSGPAYVFMFIESLADAGVQNGLPRDVARKLAAQVVYGSARMCLENSGLHTAELRNRVESPGGTTVAGTGALEQAGFRAAVQAAVKAATQRAAELG